MSPRVYDFILYNPMPYHGLLFKKMYGYVYVCVYIYIYIYVYIYMYICDRVSCTVLNISSRK